MGTAACNDCQFFDDHHANGQTPAKDEGLCRANPPITQPTPNAHGLWPVVATMDWCGHYKPEHMGH